MTIPADMPAIAITGGKGDAAALHLTSVPTPVPAEGQMLIRVAAAGVNRPDIAQREGNYPPPPGASEVLGLEVAGTVVAFGGEPGPWSVGDRVCALLPGGGYAGFAVVDTRHALPVPDDMDMAEAAALPETLFTVWANLFERGRLQAGETVLIHGANSGIGVTAIQMAKAAGARILATARGPEKTARAAALGADVAIDAQASDFAAIATAQGGADVVLDIAGAEYFARNISALKPDGRLCIIAMLGGARVELDLVSLLFKRLTITGSTLRARPADEKARLTAAIREQVWPWVVAGKVRPPIDRRFPLAEAAAAHRHLEASGHFGKIVLMM